MGLKWLRVGLGVFLFFPTYLAQTEVAPAGMQSAAPIPPPMPSDPQFNRRRNQEEPIEVRMERERLKAWNKERFENLKKDTDQLLKLATELKASVDKANKDTLSLEVIRKTEEVEKLAKQVREKMKAQ
ncbi:MAG TPA: hypothetical protein VM056_04555 [Terriglobales bacterium]|nr:hypothetical protein [Terriglobales bacterium]